MILYLSNILLKILNIMSGVACPSIRAQFLSASIFLTSLPTVASLAFFVFGLWVFPSMTKVTAVLELDLVARFAVSGGCSEELFWLGPLVLMLFYFSAPLYEAQFVCFGSIDSMKMYKYSVYHCQQSMLVQCCGGGCWKREIQAYFLLSKSWVVSHNESGGDHCAHNSLSDTMLWQPCSALLIVFRSM